MEFRFLSQKGFHSRITSQNVSRREQLLGFIIGPIGVIVMNSILSGYLNVYYTDVLQIGSLWGGFFIGTFPFVAKLIDCLTFIYMGKLIDSTHSSQGKARPWILLSAPILTVSMILLFAVPQNLSSGLTALWIFISYLLYYAVAYTAYGASHTLMIPLSSQSPQERASLSLYSNLQYMAAGTFITVIFPSLVLPVIGVNRSAWLTVTIGVALLSFPLMLLEYYYTRERVTEQSLEKNTENRKKSISLKKQLACCLKSRDWKLFTAYILCVNFCNSLSGISVFYYCNWVLGSYNDGVTQALFYALGNAPMALGIFVCNPICKKIGRRKAMAGGLILSSLGLLLCVCFPKSLPIVLLGQAIKSIGVIPSSFLSSALLGDAIDRVEEASGFRCDGFTSSVFNCIGTFCGGLAACVLNLGIGRLGYISPSSFSGAALPSQPEKMQSFFIFCALGCQLILYPIAALFLSRFQKEK